MLFVSGTTSHMSILSDQHSISESVAGQYLVNQDFRAFS